MSSRKPFVVLARYVGRDFWRFPKPPVIVVNLTESGGIIIAGRDHTGQLVHKPVPRGQITDIHVGHLAEALIPASSGQNWTFEDEASAHAFIQKVERLPS